MTEQKITIGMDRFIAKRWADYAFDLRGSDIKSQNQYTQLQEWLSHEIKGREVVEKTASQLRRLWLADDQNSSLRNRAIKIGMARNPSSRTILHYGMAINVFPFFRDLCIIAGRLIQLHGKCKGNEIQQRLLEKYQSGATVSYAARRGILTLLDWGILFEEGGGFTARSIKIEEPDYSVWYIQSILNKCPGNSANLSDLVNFTENLGIVIPDIRSAIRENNQLFLVRNGNAEEVIVFRESGDHQ